MPLKEGKYLVYIKEPGLGSFTDSITVYINPQIYWEEKGTQIDSFTEEQWEELEPILEEIGLNQINNCTFECEVFITIGELRAVLLEEGFYEDPVFNEFMVENLIPDEDDTILEGMDDQDSMEGY